MFRPITRRWGICRRSTQAYTVCGLTPRNRAASFTVNGASWAKACITTASTNTPVATRTPSTPVPMSNSDHRHPIPPAASALRCRIDPPRARPPVTAFAPPIPWGEAHQDLWSALRAKGFEVQLVAIAKDHQTVSRAKPVLRGWVNRWPLRAEQAAEGLTQDAPSLVLRQQLGAGTPRGVRTANKALRQIEKHLWGRLQPTRRTWQRCRHALSSMSFEAKPKSFCSSAGLDPAPDGRGESLSWHLRRKLRVGAGGCRTASKAPSRRGPRSKSRSRAGGGRSTNFRPRPGAWS